MRVSARGGVSACLLALFLSGWVGCNTATAPTLPQPDLQVLAGTPFPLRVGDLAYVGGLNSYLYVSVQSVGIDSRCPPEETCAEPGHLELALDLETTEGQGAIVMRIPPNGQTTGTFRGFELRTFEVQPPGSASRIQPIDYVFLMIVVELEND